MNIYTDGSHKGRYGAWAYVVVENEKIVREASGRVRKTESIRMEFQAAIEALKSLPENSTATFYSDSKILVDIMNLWRMDWKTNGWIKPNSRPIPNVDLIILLDTLSLSHNITWLWVRAHSGVLYNERCDELCLLERQS